MWWSLERDPDLCHPLRQALTGADVERDAGPAPVVDQQPERDEGLGQRTGRDVVLLAVAHHLLAEHPALRVLAANGRRRHLAVRDRPDRAQHLDLLIAD